MEPNLSQFSHHLRTRLEDPLPAETAWRNMVPTERINRSSWPEKNEHSKRSAVLMLFYEWEATIHLPLILRNIYNGPHSGQIALPGGRVEKTDQNFVDTALREANEEIGVDRDQVEVIGQLSEIFIPPSQFWVQPIIGLVHNRPDFVPDPSEVQQVIEAPLSDFLNPKNIQLKRLSLGNHLKFKAPTYQIKGHTVWGATAMMMSELVEVLTVKGK